MKRILVIKLGALGDFILAMGPCKAIRAHHSDAHISLLTTPAFAEMAKACGYFDAVFSDGRPAYRNLSGLWRLLRWLRKGNFDRVYDLQTSRRSSLYHYLIPHAQWSGIASGASHPHRNPERDSMHTLDRQAEQLAAAGINSVPPPDLSWAQTDLKRFHLPPARHYALLVPGGSAHRPAKRWPVENYASLAAWLHTKGLRAIILGSGPEQALADAIEALCPTVISFVNRTSFIDIIALARGAAVAIGNDTGPMHAIAAAGCPSLVLFSAESDPDLCAPRGAKVKHLRAGRLAQLDLATVITQLDI